MRTLIVHPDMKFMGGGERLCCDTIRTLTQRGHSITLLTEDFDARRIEEFFGYNGVFDKLELLTYPPSKKKLTFGTTSHLIHHVRGQGHALGGKGLFDLVFSTQDVGYFPDMAAPVLQWGYFPKQIPSFFESSPPRAIRRLPFAMYYNGKIARVGLVLAISEYSKLHLDKEWKRPSKLVYPACNMVRPGSKRNLVVTAGRGIPEKRLDLFWEVARECPDYEFVMLLTRDPQLEDYARNLFRNVPPNGEIIVDPRKDLYHEILGEAKVYLHLMRGEHFGITIVEAMSAGCVPIVHDSGGPKEIVDSRSGFRWNSLDEIPSMIHDGANYERSIPAIERAKDFSSEKFDERLCAIFSELQARNPSLSR